MSTSSDWYRRDNPLREAVSIYRKPETEQKEIVMSDFMEFLKDDLDEELSESDLADIQTLINKFLGYDIQKVENGEKEMLDRWINGQDVQQQEIMNIRINRIS